MALSQPKSIFGIHSFTPINRTTGEYMDEVRVLGGSELAMSGEVIELNGGSSKFPWGSADGKITTSVNLTVREYPDSFFELLLGAPITTTVISGGAVSTIANFAGSTVADATTGIASIAVTTPADLKTGRYTVIATGATTATLHAGSDISGAELLDDTLKVADLDLSADDTALGLTFTAGSAVAMNVGDSATFTVEGNEVTEKKTASVGSSSATFPEFSALIYAQKQGSSELVEIYVHKLKALGMPINMSEGAFSEYSIEMKASYDSAKDSVFEITMLK